MGRNGRDALAAQIQGHVGIIVDVDSVQTLTNALEGPSLACNDLLSTPHATRLWIEAVKGKIDGGCQNTIAITQRIPHFVWIQRKFQQPDFMNKKITLRHIA
jgi:hypothetical protein